MRYFTRDVAYFVRTSPYLALAKPQSAVRFLQRQVEAAEECQSALRSYPDVQIEPLGFLYTCLRSLGALDQAFFEALVRDHTWRGVVWGAWLAMLEPRAEFADALHAARPDCPKNEWLIDCAISAIEGRAPVPAHERIVELGARCQQSLSGIPRPVVRLRLAPNVTDSAQLCRERDRIRSLYAENGLQAALRSLPGTLIGVYAMDYLRWVRSNSMQVCALGGARSAGSRERL